MSSDVEYVCVLGSAYTNHFAVVFGLGEAQTLWKERSWSKCVEYGHFCNGFHPQPIQFSTQL